MQTIYYRTEHFIRHQGNLVEEPVPDAEPRAQGPELYLLPKPAPMTPRRRMARRQRRLRRAAVVLDLCASIAVVALTAGALAAFLGLLG